MTTPQRRRQHAATFHPIGNYMLMFGGSLGGVGALGDTWLLNYMSAWPDEVCTSGTDDDSDSLTDCADPDCDGKACSGGVCTAGVCQ